MKICGLALLTIILLADVMPVNARKRPRTKTPSSARQLIDARRANEQAQAEYYREQTLRLRNPTPTPTPSSSPW